MTTIGSAPSRIAFAAILLAAGDAGAQSIEETLREMQAIIAAQQRQLQTLQQEVEALKAANTELRTTVTATEESVDVLEETVGTEPLVTSGTPKVQLSVSGQINRAFNVADDGESTDYYFVDNDVSNSRVRFQGTGDVGDGTTLGTTIELAVSPNNSYDVSQDNEEAGDFFDERVVEVFARNDAYGRVSFGKGSAAADNTAEYDLSLVAGPIMYAGVADPVGGLQFTDGDDLTGVTVGDVFFDFDGDRQNRILYESPLFGPGVQVAASLGSSDRWDLALTWGGDYGNWSGVELGDFITLGAISIRDPNEDDVDFRLAGSWSMLHDPTGVSFTASAGMDERDTGDTPYNLYAKLGWDTELFSFGKTGFGVDYTHGENFSGDGDTNDSIGLAAVQLIDSVGVELYGQTRWYTVDRDVAPDFEDIFVATLGTRVKF
jgi:hypothetical protein